MKTARNVLTLFAVLALFLFVTDSAFAKKKGKKNKKLSNTAELLTPEWGGVCIKDGDQVTAARKITKKNTIIEVKTNKKKFKQNKRKTKQTQKKLNKKNISPKKAERLRKKLERFQRNQIRFNKKLSIQACQAAFANGGSNPKEGGEGDGSSGGDNNSPDPELVPYKGKFTKLEAAKLFRRYGFGATWAELERAEKEGLKKTVDRMLTWDQGCEDQLTPRYFDIICEGEQWYWDNEPDLENEECILADPNDFSIEGLKRAHYYKFMNTCNPVHYKFLTVVHSKNASGQIDALNNNEEKKWFAKQHFEVHLLNFAKTFDYGSFIIEQAIGKKDGLGVGDPLVNFFNLDSGASFAVLGQDGVTRTAANENYGRELLELSTVGTMNTYSNPNSPEPVYGLLDVASASNALAGGGYVTREFEVGKEEDGDPIIAEVDYPTIIFQNEIRGPKTMWLGTKWETTIDTREDLVNTILAHPMTAHNMAQKLLWEYVTENPSPKMVAELSDIIRKDDLNVKNAIKALMTASFNFDGSAPRLQTTFDFVFSFLRSTELPMRMSLVSDLMRACGQEVGGSQNRSAGAIFGWNVRQLNGASYAIQCRNELLDLLEYYPSVQNRLRNELFYGPDFAASDALLKDKPFYYRGDVWLVEKIATLFGEDLNDAQLQLLVDEIMNGRPELCNTQQEVDQYGCELDTYYTRGESWSEDPGNDTGHIWKISALLAALVDRPAYRVIQ